MAFLSQGIFFLDAFLWYAGAEVTCNIRPLLCGAEYGSVPFAQNLSPGSFPGIYI